LKFDDLDIPDRLKSSLRSQGYTDLYPPQEEAVPHVLAGRSTVLSIPTASGKSLVAYLAILNSVLRGGKAIYIVPLRALASEKYEELRRFEDLGVRVAMSVGDFDAPEISLERFDIIVATSEKTDSLLRHRMSWLEKVSVVVADEIHLINDPGRGPTLEVILSKFRMINPDVQIVALSATINNSPQVAEWLDAEHVSSDWRPVPLREGVCLDGRLSFSDGTRREIADSGDPVTSLVEDCLSGSGQVLIFVNTRRASESLAKSLAPVVRRHIPDAKEARRISKALSAEEEEPTLIGKHLSTCMKSGTAFHNAGLSNAQRRKVEDHFREGKIRCAVATPTLAAGINLPARMVIVRDTGRFDANYGFSAIPVLEVKQMSGRAGRPKYDSFGEALLIAKDEEHASFLMENYVLGEPEEVYSKLGTEPALRSHVLAAVATGTARSEEEIAGFFEHTFLAVQTEVAYLREILERILDFLEKQEMIRREEKGALRATFFGKRVSDLYLDPQSAVTFRNALSKLGKRSDFGILHAVAATTEMQTLYLRQRDYEWVEELLDERRSELLIDVPDDLAQYEFFLSELKTAALISDWAEEKSEESIERRFGIGPGDIRNKMEIAEWMAYSMDQLSAIFMKEAHPLIEPLVRRIRYGVREELLDLVKLRNIGRVRARILYDGGFRNIEEVRTAPVEKISALPGIGNKLALLIKRELGQESGARENIDTENGQRRLSDFPEKRAR